MSSSATSAEVAFEARAACASLIACCATAVALSRIDCGSEGLELTSVSNDSAVCRRTTAEAKDIQFRNDAYKTFLKVYHPTSFSSSPPPCYPYWLAPFHPNSCLLPFQRPERSRPRHVRYRERRPHLATQRGLNAVAPGRK